MTWKQGVIVAIGISVAVALYFLRTSPERGSVMQKQIDTAQVSLSVEQLQHVRQLQEQYEAATQADEQLAALREQIRAWDSFGKPVLAALYAYRTVAIDSSLDNLIDAADYLVEAGDANRSNENEQNLTYYLYETAGNLYDRVLARSPGNEDALIGKSMVDIQGRGKVMDGVQRLLSIVERDSMNVKANLTLGRLNLVNGQYPKAIDRMEKVLEQEPLNLSALTAIGNAYAAIGNRKEAIRHYELALSAAENEDLKSTIRNRLNELKN